ncbi:hypothetical protein SESBI_35319 [Sesbania bispinosa]|nr:hypothetical protein SESBI_35319 [Sesbania bispinosa]
MPRTEEEFPIGRAECAPNDDVGWHFGTHVPGKSRNIVACKYFGKVLSGGVTRLEEHLAHIPGEVKGYGLVPSSFRESMMKLLQDNKAKKKDLRKRKEEFMSRLRGDEDDEIEGFFDEDSDIRKATQESLIPHRQ